MGRVVDVLAMGEDTALEERVELSAGAVVCVVMTGRLSATTAVVEEGMTGGKGTGLAAETELACVAMTAVVIEVVVGNGISDVGVGTEGGKAGALTGFGSAEGTEWVGSEGVAVVIGCGIGEEAMACLDASVFSEIAAGACILFFSFAPR